MSTYNWDHASTRHQNSKMSKKSMVIIAAVVLAALAASFAWGNLGRSSDAAAEAARESGYSTVTVTDWHRHGLQLRPCGKYVKAYAVTGTRNGHEDESVVCVGLFDTSILG